MGKYKYNPGDYLGPKKDILFIEEAGSKIVGKTSPRKVRQGKFKCSFCNNIFISSVNDISSGHKKSCGCLNSPNLTGKRFGKLVVIRKTKQKDF